MPMELPQSPPSTLEVLREHSPLLEQIREGRDLRSAILRSLATALLGSAFFGLALGSYAQSLPQLMASMLKVPLLLVGTAVLCFPTFHIFQTWRAPRPLAWQEALALQSTVLATVALIWASLAPPIIFLIASTHHYKLAQTLTLLAGATGGFVGLGRLRSGYHALCRQHEDSAVDDSGNAPNSRAFLLTYFVVFGAVGGQLAWMLRPFLGSPTLPFQIFRPIDPADGNLFLLILDLLGMR